MNSATSKILFAAALLFAGSLCVHAENTPSTNAVTSPWGVAASAHSTREFAEWFPKVSAAGVTSCRMFVTWDEFEPTKGKWNIHAADKMLSAAKNNHLELNGMFLYSAPWAIPPGVKGAAFPMGHLNDWAEYCGKVTTQYKDRIHYWEIWNEGNGAFKGQYSKDKWDTTADYATLSATAYEAIKKSDPNAQVGLSIASLDIPYLDQVALLQAKMGKPESFDFFCIHPYEIAGGLNEADGEIPYLWMAKMLRDVMKVDAPNRPNPEIWITEIGRKIGNEKESKEADLVTEEVAAQTLVKTYTMAIAQGIQRISWFEAQDPHGEDPGYGLLRIDGTKRPAYVAMKSLTSTLGATPKYLGWLALGEGGKSYGFVFQGPAGPVLILWMPLGATDKTITFSGEVKVTDPSKNLSSTLAGNQPLPLTDKPVIVTSLPADLVTQAQANSTKNFPWGGDYTDAKTVNIQLGNPNTNNGIMQVERTWTKPYKFDDNSTGALVSPPAKHDSQNIKFIIHPSFANLKTHEFYIRVTARRISPPKAKNCGMNLIYEVADSRGSWPTTTTVEWFGLSDDTTTWQTHTWHVTDAAFSKMWDYDIAFSIADSDPFVIGKVEVSTEPFAN